MATRPSSDTFSDQQFIEAGIRFVLEGTDLKGTLTSLVRAAANAACSSSGSLFLLNRERGCLEPYVLVDVSPEYVAGCSSVPLGAQCCGRAALHKIPWVVEDMWTDPLFKDCREAAIKSGMRSGFSVPVLDAGDDCLGTLASHFREPHTPSTYDIERQRLFAQLIAFAIARDQVNRATVADLRQVA